MATFVERGQAVPPAETLAIVVGREMTEAARAKAADPGRRSKIGRASRDQWERRRQDGTFDQQRREMELGQAMAYLRKYIAAHRGREGDLARYYLERFSKAAERGSGAKTVMADFKREPALYGQVFSEVLGAQGWRANTGGRRRAGLNQSMALWYRHGTGGTKKAPRLRDLIDPPDEGRGARAGRKGKIPAEFRSWDRVPDLSAVVHMLSQGQDKVDIGHRFGWPVEEERRCRMADGFAKVGLKLSTSKRFAVTWHDALRAAEEYLGVPAAITPGAAERVTCALKECDLPRAPKPLHGPQSSYCSKTHQQRDWRQRARLRGEPWGETKS